jgi:hypothetical protein
MLISSFSFSKIIYLVVATFFETIFSREFRMQSVLNKEFSIKIYLH